MKSFFFIAQRYTKKQKSNQTWVGKLSKLCRYSIALATTILVLVLSTMRGMEVLLIRLFETSTAALTITAQQGVATFASENAIKTGIMAIAAVEDIVEILETKILVKSNQRSTMLNLHGVSNNFLKSDHYKQHTGKEDYAFSMSKNGIHHAIIDRHTSRWLKLDTTQKVNHVDIFYPRKITPTGFIDQSYKKAILAIDSYSNKGHPAMIAPIALVEALTTRMHQRSAWEIILKDERADVHSVKADIEQILPNHLKVSTRYEQNHAKRKALAIEKIAVYFISTLVLLLASLHIFFMLCMLIIEKKADLLLLHALGAHPRQIGNIFIYHAMLVSLQGTLYGLVIAWILGSLQQQFGCIKLKALKNMGIIAYPVEMCCAHFIYAASVTVLLSLMSALWPAKQAQKLRPPA